MGIDNYIAQQLSPEKIDDSASEASCKPCDAAMTTAEIYEKYPQPNQLLQQTSAAWCVAYRPRRRQDNRVKAAPMPSQARTRSRLKPPGEMQGPEMTNGNDAPKTNAPANNDTNPMNNAEYRKAVMEYYKENNLPSGAIPDRRTANSRILRLFTASGSCRKSWLIFGLTISTCTPPKARTAGCGFLRPRHDSAAHIGEVHDLLVAMRKAGDAFLSRQFSEREPERAATAAAT